MAYDKQTWDTTSYVNPTRMNHIEDGIKEQSDRIDVLDYPESSSIAPVATSPTESAISSGSHFMYNGVRMVATSAIASGATLVVYPTVGYNCKAESVEDMFEYSTTERVVGKWTDGKPIYEKTVTIPNFNIDQTSTWFPNTHFGKVTVADYFSNADKMWCDLNGTFYIISSSAYRNIMFVDTQLPSLVVFSIPEYTNGTLTLTMRYTKTTD